MAMDSQCAKCGLTNGERVCRKPDGKAPEFCATVKQREIIERAAAVYNDPAIRAFANAASAQEGAGYTKVPNAPDKIAPAKTRIQEIIEFCQRMRYERIGLAFCGSFHREAAILAKMLEAHGLAVVSAMCKVGGIAKEYIGVKEEEKVRPCSFETMCNPIAQAMILNDAQTQFNLVMGLCVGHDSLFLKNSEALCTVVAVKDRLTGHNPMAAIYLSHSSYNYLMGTPP